MHRLLGLVIGTAAAVLASPVSRADVLPLPPDDPIPEACEPLLGAWQRMTPETNRFARSWTILVVDSTQATLLRYVDQASGVNITATASQYRLDCRSDGETLRVAFNAISSDRDFAMAMRVTGNQFLTRAETTYDSPGPPPDDWQPSTYPVVYQRIVP